MTSVPYVDLSSQWREEGEELKPIVNRVLDSGTYIGGKEVDGFEAECAEISGMAHCIALNSGTDALVCALIAAGVKRGDEVITPPNSFIASTAAIVHLGAIPVFVDVIEDQSIDPDAIENCITSKTKAIMPVHLTGRMAKMDEIIQVATKFGLPVIEDSAQSIGSKYKGLLSGTSGDFGCFSTHPLKNLNACGDGGFVLTNNTAAAQSIRSMRNHGLVDRNTVESFGYVSRMDAIQAAILRYRLQNLEKVITKRRENASFYYEALDRKCIFIPEESEDYFNTFHTFVIQVEDRENLIKYLANAGIQTAIHYPVPIHLQPAAAAFGYKLGDFPVTEMQSTKILTLPINQSLSSDQLEYIAVKVNAFYDI